MTFNPKCWEFSDEESVSFPCLPLSLRNPEITSREVFLNFKLDTGFHGTIGITDELVDKLQLNSSGVMVLSTTIGEKKVNYYQLLIENSEWGLNQSLVYAVKTTRLLIGRTVLKGKQFLLDFKNFQVCYLREQ